MASVHLEVANQLPFSPRLEVRATWLDRPIALWLTDDGTVSWDQAHDGIWVGTLEGEAIRSLPIQIYLETGEKKTLLWQSVESIEGEEDDLVYVLEQADGGPQLERVAAPWLGQARPDHERTRVAVMGTWTLLLFGWVGIKALRWRD